MPSTRKVRRKRMVFLTPALAKTYLRKNIEFTEEKSPEYMGKILGFVPVDYIEKYGEKVYSSFSEKTPNITVKNKEGDEYQMFLHRGRYFVGSGSDWVKIRPPT